MLCSGWQWGDALGTTLEFKSPGSFEPISDMVGGGVFRLLPGQWTDDTSMALCLATSLIAKQGFDPADQMQRYVRWWRDGYLSSTGDCFDIGGAVSGALQRFEQTGDPFAGDPDPIKGGKRLADADLPLFPAAYAGNPEKAIFLAGQMSRTTHAAPEPIDACRYYAGLIIGALNGISKQELLSDRFSPTESEQWAQGDLAESIQSIAKGSFKRKQPPENRG